MKIFKTANYKKVAQANSILNGKSKQSAKNIIYKLVEPYTKGFFSDDSWVPVHSIWKALESRDITWEITNSKYDKDEKGTPIRKMWYFKISFIDNKNKQIELPGMITAAGAGTVQDPLSRYDITFVI
jgi:hypothetical protein